MKKQTGAMRVGAALLLCALITACHGGRHSGASGSGTSSSAPPPPIAATVVIAGSDIALAPGTSSSFTAQALDANGNPIATTFTWYSSDEAVATVVDGTVTAVALGQVQITAETNGVVSAARNVFVNPSGGAEQAIAAALATGEITEEQALTYEVFALYNDPRLPGKFLGTSDQPDNVHDLVLDEVINRFESLSSQSQDLIGPYLVPPTYWHSAGSVTSSSKSAKVVQRLSEVQKADIGGILNRPTYCLDGIPLSGWTAVDTTHFRVWYNADTHSEQAATATDVSNYAETAYAALTSVGFKAPLSDDYWVCDGGDGRTDIYLMEQSLGDRTLALTFPLDDNRDGSTSAAFIEISPTAFNGDLKGIVAHEVMHAIQHAYTNLGSPNYFWTLDSTAEWAVSFVYPNDTSTAGRVGSFVEDAHMPLFYPNNYCKNSGASCEDPHDDLKMYGAYLFFEFMSNYSVFGPGAVSQFFTNAAFSDNPLTAINFVLSGQGGLTKVWPQFSLALWNQDPVPGALEFMGWDGKSMWTPARIHSKRDISKYSLPAKTPSRFMVFADQQIKVNELSAVYNEYDFTDDVHSVVFYNGFSARMTMKDTQLGEYLSWDTIKYFDAGNTYAMYAPTADQIKGRHIWALKKINGTWMPPEDWTGNSYMPLCLDAADQRVQSLILIFSNGNFTTSRSNNFEDGAIDSLGDQSSIVTASATPCWKYNGTYQTTLSVDQNGDKFAMATTLKATYVGQPNYGQVNFSDGPATVFLGWLFTADQASINFNAMVKGLVNSCYLGAYINDSYNTWWQNSPLPSFRSWVFPINSAAYNGYSGGTIGWQPYFVSCSDGKKKKLPAVRELNFNVSLDALHEFEKVDLTNGKLDSGGPIQSPPWDNGDYAADPAHQVINTWCLAALRENEPSPTGKCP